MDLLNPSSIVWKRLKLGDVADVIDPHPSHRAPEAVDKGVPFAGIGDIDDYGNIDFSSARIVSEDVYLTQCENFVINDFSFGYGRVGTVGKIVSLKQRSDNYKYTLSPTLCVITPKKNIDPYYLRAVIESQIFSGQVQKRITGSTRPTIGIQQLRELYIVVPTKKEQEEYIGRIWHLAFSKAENSLLINAVLEEQVQTVFNSMFQKYYKNEFEMLPQGFKRETLRHNSISHIIKPKVDRFDCKIYYPTANVNNLSFDSDRKITFDNRETRANMQPTLYSVWFAKMKNSIKHLLLNKEMQNFIDGSILSTGFCGIQCSELSFEYVATFIRRPDFEKEKDFKAHGTTQEAVNLDDLDKILFITPSNAELQKFHAFAKPFYNKIVRNLLDSKKYIELKNTLIKEIFDKIDGE